MQRTFKNIFKVIRDFCVDGFVESLKGLVTGGSVGAIISSWQGFVIGIISGSILGAFFGSTLSKLFDWLLEKIHLLMNLRKIKFTLEIKNIPNEIGNKIQANYLLIRYGRDEVIPTTVISKQDQLATKLRNKIIKIPTRYNAEKETLTLNITMKRHITFGIQFKLFFTGITLDEIKPAFSKCEFIKEVSEGGGNNNNIYVLLEEKTKVSTDKGDKFFFNITRSPEGIPNNFIYPK